MNKYEKAIEALDAGKDYTMKVFGNSMTPIIKSGSKLTFRQFLTYRVGDVCLSKIRGRYVDAHKITKIDASGRYLISNNKGHDNGWTKKVFGRVIKIEGQPFGRKAIDI